MPIAVVELFLEKTGESVMKKAMIISFQFAEKHYLAMVKVKKNADNDQRYEVRFLNESLHNILAPSELVDCDLKVITEKYNSDSRAIQLLQCFNESLDAHIRFAR